MWNAGLDEAQAGIKTAGRNINNLRYADDTTREEETKSFLKSRAKITRITQSSSEKQKICELAWRVLPFLDAAAAAAKSLQSCPTLCDPIDGSQTGSPIPGTLQTRVLDGLPFPSPMHESKKWKWSRSAMSNSSPPHRLQPTRLCRPWDFPGKSTGVGCHCLLDTTSNSITFFLRVLQAREYWVK